MSAALQLHPTRHPDRFAEARYNELFGLDAHKQELLSSLQLIFQPDRIDKWRSKYHPKGIPLLGISLRQSPLVLLSGDVGCGKTELAQSVGTPLNKAMGGETIVAFDTPSDVRGMGLVGEVSARITSTFASVRQQLKKNEFGLLIIDEADDLASTREQAQAHHEDRAGVNALIKEIDRIERDRSPIAVILITNRATALDPAVLRRATTHIKFTRPDESALRSIFEQAAKGLNLKAGEIETLVGACLEKSPLFSYSDIFRKVARKALLDSFQKNQAVSLAALLDAIDTTIPSPTFIG